MFHSKIDDTVLLGVPNLYLKMIDNIETKLVDSADSVVHNEVDRDG